MTDKGFSCASTTCPGTEEESTRNNNVEDESSHYVPHPQVEGPGSSAVGRPNDLLVPRHMMYDGKATQGVTPHSQVEPGHNATSSGWQFSNMSTMSSFPNDSFASSSLSRSTFPEGLLTQGSSFPSTGSSLTPGRDPVAGSVPAAGRSNLRTRSVTVTGAMPQNVVTHGAVLQNGIRSEVMSLGAVPSGPVVSPGGVSSSRLVAGPHDNLTFVSSVDTGYSVVPPPQTVAGQVPECGRWTGDAYGQAVAQERDVAFVQERIVYKPVKQIVHRPVEKTTLVPKVIKKEVVEFRQIVTDEVIEVPKPYAVETQVFIPRYVDHPTSCALSQNYLPVYSVAEAQTAVECTRYEPEIRIVDVKVPKIIDGELIVKTRDTKLKHIPRERVSKAQWNSLVLKINPDLCKIGDLQHLPVHRDRDGHVIAFKPETTVGASIAAL